jgi:excisionase family DNA binding protein
MPKKSPPETPLYVRLPATASEKLDRASEELRIPKKDLVANLVEKHLGGGAPMMGHYSFEPYSTSEEVMGPEQAALFLRIDVKVILELAEGGKLPGRKLGKEWRFSRTALLAWLSTTETR